jgi:HK97 family phage major capsid protein
MEIFQMKLLDLKQQYGHAMNKADSILQAAESAGRELTTAESLDVETCMAAANALKPQIAERESKSTIRKMFPNGQPILDGAPSPSWDGPAGAGNARAFQTNSPRKLTAEYADAFFDWIGTRGQKPSAALYEGSGPAGGFVVPGIVDQQIVPLAPGDMGVRSIATVVPTSMDIKVPRQSTFSTASAKAESGASSNSFTESEPTLDQFTLSAFMAGLTHICSWELLEDVPSFQAFAVGDMLTAQQLFEENWYVNGTGTGQAQGLIGNVGTGTGAAVLVGSDNYGSELLDATIDVLGTLKGQYHEGASFLMQRATGILLRKAQKQANLFEQVFTRSNGQDYLHGYPVTYSTAMPAVAAGNTPVLFGNFKIGYVIGDRGGSGINVKILDQPLATQGQTILLAYRRTDGRVRRSEAIQGVTLHS